MSRIQAQREVTGTAAGTAYLKSHNSKLATGRTRIVALGLTFAALCLACCAPGAASAATTRPFVEQIPGTPTGAGGAEVPFNWLGGIAVDGSGNLWVANQRRKPARDRMG